MRLKYCIDDNYIGDKIDFNDQFLKICLKIPRHTLLLYLIISITNGVFPYLKKVSGFHLLSDPQIYKFESIYSSTTLIYLTQFVVFCNNYPKIVKSLQLSSNLKQYRCMIKLFGDFSMNLQNKGYLYYSHWDDNSTI